MRILCAILALLLFVSVSSAGIVNLSTDKAEYVPGETVTISIIPNVEISSFALRIISATPNMGTASAGTLYEGFNFLLFDGSQSLVNNGNNLFFADDKEAVSGVFFVLAGPGSNCPAGIPLYTFDYVLGEDATEGLVELGVSEGIANDAATAEGYDIQGTSFTVVPEPLSFSLFGLGCLAVIRRGK